MINDASTPFANHAFTMRIIHHQDDIVFLDNLIDLIQRGNVTIHAEDTIRDDHYPGIFSVLLTQNPVQILRVTMGIADDLGA